ncbi:hypothetical protein FIBSPDRAFT_362130 [Athelia psychrophila]|uniref:Uncharacterized protein n=1 Tax=Athelia psychrophila TaxID=1759441 RepID=A0A166PCQ1_9AGAM|nr:hypothetical protein FIBSPDRAFT_536816 [Fibularhizoctonia sp. CBS 109695]KZP25954.1 hypothetical protein FIBSPDRAFT_362130 [Fibularhizoctonia sp. CBS 109695]
MSVPILREHHIHIIYRLAYYCESESVRVIHKRQSRISSRKGTDCGPTTDGAAADPQHAAPQNITTQGQREHDFQSEYDTMLCHQ